MLRLFEASFTIYNKLIAERFNIDLHALEQLMEDVPTMLPISVIIKPSSTAVPPPQGTVQALTAPKEKDNTREAEPKALVVDPSCCPYYIKRGPKANTICGSKKRKGNEFCGKHTKKEDKPAKKVEEKEKEEKEDEGKQKETVDVPKKKNLVLRMNKVINKWWHSESGLVFKSSDDKVVIGVFKDDQIVDLSDTDIEKCIAYKFRYEVTKRKRSEEEEEDDEEVAAVETKRQKTEDNDFINLNKSAKNVEALIKEMFTTTTTPSLKKGVDSDSETEEVNEEISECDGAEESKTNDLNAEISESEDEVCDEEEILEEEENDEE